jgi:carbamoyltransferase
MLIVGLNAFHPDSAACLLRDGQLVAAVAEERLGTRRKHVAGFPGQALRTVLQMAGASIRDVEYVAVGNDSNANIPAKVARVLRTPIESAVSVLTHFQRRAQARSFPELIAEACGASEADCRFKVVRVEHHLAHLASSYFASDFDEAAGFSYDGSGDFTSAMFARCQGNRIEILDRVHVPHSLGFFYTALCQFIGFERFGEEYKVMGLAAYGSPIYQELMGELLQIGLSVNGYPLLGRPNNQQPTTNNHPFKLNPKYFTPLGKNLEDCVDPKTGEIVLPPLYSPELVARLGAPRSRHTEITQREMDLAASCQAHFERAVLASLGHLHTKVPTENLVTAGGCALNGVCNARILRDTPFRRSYIQCAASDDGTAIGAAYYVWNVLLGKPRAGSVDHAYWGPEYPERDMEKALRDANLPYERLETDPLVHRTTDLLANGQIIGWFQGRSEWGPRALGNRSILAHPGWPGMKDLINKKIKRREAFRPFAPSILVEEVGNYFEQTVESPFMMHVVKIKPDKRPSLSAVCHADHTGRLHTVKRTQNPLYYDLIKTFAARTGTPVLLNTSFNENEPIVDTPAQAVSCFVRTDLDALVVGPFLAVKGGRE